MVKFISLNMLRMLLMLVVSTSGRMQDIHRICLRSHTFVSDTLFAGNLQLRYVWPRGFWASGIVDVHTNKVKVYLSAFHFLAVDM